MQRGVSVCGVGTMEDSGISKEQSDAAAENVGRWQVSKGSVTHIAEMQLDVIYDVEDRVQECSSTSSEYLVRRRPEAPSAVIYFGDPWRIWFRGCNCYDNRNKR